MTETQAPNIFEALNAVMRDVSHVSKNDRNDHQRFMFRGIDAVMNACGPALRKHGVIAVPNVLETHYSTTQTRNGGQATICRLKMCVTWHGPAGDNLNTIVWGEAFDSGDKATAKAHSVAFRTAFLETLCLPTDEPDPAHDSYEQVHVSPEDRRREELKAFEAQCDLFVSRGQREPLERAVEYWGQHGDAEKLKVSQAALARLNGAGDEPAAG